MKSPTPTHITLVPNRSMHMRKEHIQGAAGAEGTHDLTQVVKAGQSVSIQRSAALDLLAAEVAWEDNALNRDKITDFREELKAAELRAKEGAKTAKAA